MNKIKKQKIQDLEYVFPYHYVPQYRPVFTQVYNWTWGINYVSALEFILGKIEKCSAKQIADIGTGDGRLVKEIAERYPDKTVRGIDYSERGINLARAINPELEFVQMDITREKSKEKYDLLTLIEVFEHIPPKETDKFVEGLAGILKKDGVLLLTVPHKNKKLQDKHFQHFTPEALKNYFLPYFELEEELLFEKRGKMMGIINVILANRFWILNHQGCKDYLYRLYKKHCFYADETNAGRIFLKLRKR